MPRPDDPSNLGNNLYTISRLSKSPAGSKLSYDKGTGRFSIQMPHALQGLARTLSHDMVTSEEYFGRPIRAVFAAAYPGRSQNQFNDALAGLRSLRRSYTGDKRAALDAVISDAEHGTDADTRGSIRLREKYKRFLIYGFQQAMFLPPSNDGICYSFTIDWGRRILLGGKVSFATSAKPASAAMKGTTLDAAQKARMMKKVDSRIRDLQAGFNRYYEEQELAPNRAFPMLAREDQFRAKYGRVQVFESVRYQRGIAADAGGSGVLADVVTQAARDARVTNVFIVNFKHKSDPGGHAIGIHLPGDGLHFFDPNIGEFWFPNAARAECNSFLDDWWEMFYIVRRPGTGEEQSELLPPGQYFESWKLEGVVGTAV